MSLTIILIDGSVFKDYKREYVLFCYRLFKKGVRNVEKEKGSTEIFCYLERPVFFLKRRI